MFLTESGLIERTISSRVEDEIWSISGWDIAELLERL